MISLILKLHILKNKIKTKLITGKLKWCIYNIINNSQCFGLISNASNAPSEGSIKNGKGITDGGLNIITGS